MPAQSGEQWAGQGCAPLGPSERDIAAKDSSSLPQPRARMESVARSGLMTTCH